MVEIVPKSKISKKAPTYIANVNRIFVSKSPMSIFVKLLTKESMVTNSAGFTSFFLTGKMPVA